MKLEILYADNDRLRTPFPGERLQVAQDQHRNNQDALIVRLTESLCPVFGETNSRNDRIVVFVEDHIIAGLVERLPPQLEAPASPTPRDTPQTVAEDAGGVKPRPATEGAQEAAERCSWWRRMFG